MFTIPDAAQRKDSISEMIMLKRMEFPTNSHKLVPVIIERYVKKNVLGSEHSLKFLVSSDMTVSQLVFIIRHRMKLSIHNSFHLLLKMGWRVVKMSQRLGRISAKYKDQRGVLQFLFVTQNTFGCPVPQVKPIKSEFPGSEPNPFGAPAPSSDTDPEDIVISIEVLTDDLSDELSDESIDEPPLSQLIPGAYVNDMYLLQIFTHSPVPQFVHPPTPLPALPQDFSLANYLKNTQPETSNSAVVELLKSVELLGCKDVFSSNGFDPDAMDVSEAATDVQESTIVSLVRALDEMVPISQIRFSTMSQNLLSMLSATEEHSQYVPLMKALDNLVQLLENYLPLSLDEISAISSQYGTLAIPHYDMQPYNYLYMPLFYTPSYHSALANDVNPSSSHIPEHPTPSSGVAKALRCARQLMASLESQGAYIQDISSVTALAQQFNTFLQYLQGDYPSPSEDLAQLNIMSQYLDQVCQHIHFHNLLAKSVLHFLPDLQEL